jgi:HlyD family secretion protein
VENGRRASQRQVDVLARNGNEAWIKSELPPGSEVILFPPSSLKDGDRVKKLAGA